MGTLDEYQSQVRSGGLRRVVTTEEIKQMDQPWHKELWGKINWVLVLSILFFVASLFLLYKGGLDKLWAARGEMVPSAVFQSTPPPQPVTVSKVTVTPAQRRARKRAQRRAIKQVKRDIAYETLKMRERIYTKMVDSYWKDPNRKNMILRVQL